jgi:hypothetical protein
MDDRTRQQQEQARISQPILDEMRRKQQILEAQATQQIQEELARHQPRIQQQQEEFLRQLEQQYVRRIQAEANNPLMQQVVQMEWSASQPQVQEQLISWQEQQEALITQPIMDELRRRQQILADKAEQEIQRELERHRQRMHEHEKAAKAARQQEQETPIRQDTPIRRQTPQDNPTDRTMQEPRGSYVPPRATTLLPRLDTRFAQQQGPRWTRKATDAFCLGWAFFLLGESVRYTPEIADNYNQNDMIGIFLHKNWANRAGC